MGIAPLGSIRKMGRSVLKPELLKYPAIICRTVPKNVCPQMATVLTTQVMGNGGWCYGKLIPPVLLFLISLPFVSSLDFTFIILQGVVWPRPPSERMPVALAAPPRSSAHTCTRPALGHPDTWEGEAGRLRWRGSSGPSLRRNHRRPATHFPQGSFLHE